jgi:serine/threonine protein kinase
LFFRGRVFGKNPLKGADYKETFKNNSNCVFEIPSKPISEELRDLITRATVKDPKYRVDIDQFLSHDLFFCNISDSDEFETKFNPSKYLYPPFFAWVKAQIFYLGTGIENRNSKHFWTKNAAHRGG